MDRRVCARSPARSAGEIRWAPHRERRSGGCRRSSLVRSLRGELSIRSTRRSARLEEPHRRAHAVGDGAHRQSAASLYWPRQGRGCQRLAHGPQRSTTNRVTGHTGWNAQYFVPRRRRQGRQRARTHAVPMSGSLVFRLRSPVSIEGGDAPGWQGATTENTGAYLREEQRRQTGCSAGRMQQEF